MPNKQFDRTVIIISKYTLFLNFDIQEPIFFCEAFENFSHIFAAPSDLIAYFNKETLFVVQLEYFQAYILKEHKNGEMVFNTKAKQRKRNMEKFLQLGSNSLRPSSTTKAKRSLGYFSSNFKQAIRLLKADAFLFDLLLFATEQKHQLLQPKYKAETSTNQPQLIQSSQQLHILHILSLHPIISINGLIQLIVTKIRQQHPRMVIGLGSAGCLWMEPLFDKLVLSVNWGIIQHHISCNQKCPMNPSQSESFWKSLLQDDIQRMRIPSPHLPANVQPKQPLLPQSNPLLLREIPVSQPNHQLQTLQKMKSDKDIPLQWNPHLQHQLFTLHSQIGNKWSAIATRLGCPNDNSVKNKFYSTIRRGFRKLNKYITQVKRKRSAAHLSCNKLIKAQFLVKVTAVADNSHEQKYEVKDIAIKLSQQIQKQLIQLATNSTNYQENLNRHYDFEEKLLTKVKEFNRNCKKRKGKRKAIKNKQSSDESDSQDQKILPQNYQQKQQEPQVINKNEQEQEKEFRNQEVQYPDALMMQEEKAEEKEQIFQIGLSQSLKTPIGYYTDPSPKSNFCSHFAKRANKFFPQSSLTISKDSKFYNMNNKQLIQENNVFFQNIPRIKSNQQALISSVELKRQAEAYQPNKMNSSGSGLFSSKDQSINSSTKMSESHNFPQ